MKIIEITIEKTISMGQGTFEFEKYKLSAELDATDFDGISQEVGVVEATRKLKSHLNQTVLATSALPKLSKALLIQKDPDQFKSEQVEWASDVLNKRR